MQVGGGQQQSVELTQCMDILFVEAVRAAGVTASPQHAETVWFVFNNANSVSMQAVAAVCVTVSLQHAM